MKRLVKRVILALALVIVGLPALIELIARRIAGRDVFFCTQSQILSLIPGRIGSYLRNAYYHLMLIRCPLNCRIEFGTLFTHSEAELGNRVYIGMRCMIGMAKIGDDTMLADGVQLLSGKHQHGISRPDVPFQQQKGSFTTVSIGANCWVGTNAIVMSNVGVNCVIGAGSVVTKPITEGSLAVGMPAKPIKSDLAATSHS